MTVRKPLHEVERPAGKGPGQAGDPPGCPAAITTARRLTRRPPGADLSARRRGCARLRRYRHSQAAALMLPCSSTSHSPTRSTPLSFSHLRDVVCTETAKRYVAPAPLPVGLPTPKPV